MRIVMTGATGLVGGLLVHKLGEHDLSLVGRRPVADAPVRTKQLVGPITDWPKLVSQSSYDVAICCLGTTIRAAGSRVAFAAIDRDAVADFAAAARAAGARQLLMVSSVGANPEARNFYLKTKGEAEAAAQAAGFEQLDIFRPGLLRGHRTGFMMAVSPITDLLTPNVFDQYRSIPAETVACAIAASIGREGSNTRIRENRDMLRLAGIR